MLAVETVPVIVIDPTVKLVACMFVDDIDVAFTVLDVIVVETMEGAYVVPPTYKFPCTASPPLTIKPPEEVEVA
jgi:hypothetical protein